MRLWNGHRRVFYKKPLVTKKAQTLRKQPDGWRQLLREDIVNFVDRLESYGLAGSELEQKERVRQLLHSPARFLSRPKNVPLELRKQVYLPDFTITLIRTPHLPPRYASFWVPLWFNKLDLKGYLKNVYDVDVLHVRSFVQQQKVKREERTTVDGATSDGGRLYRPPARKKMTVELVDPFVYPEEVRDLSPWEADSFKREVVEQQQLQEEMSRLPQFKGKVKERDSIAQQAQDYLKGKKKWKPSWNLIPTDAKVLLNTTQPPGIRRTM